MSPSALLEDRAPSCMLYSMVECRAKGGHSTSATVFGSVQMANKVHHTLGGMFALRAPGALLLDDVPPEEPPSTPLGNALRIR